jgi:hypothetical protein
VPARLKAVTEHRQGLLAPRTTHHAPRTTRPAGPDRRAVNNLVIDLRDLGRTEQEVADELDRLSLPGR